MRNIHFYIKSDNGINIDISRHLEHLAIFRDGVLGNFTFVPRIGEGIVITNQRELTKDLASKYSKMKYSISESRLTFRVIDVVYSSNAVYNNIWKVRVYLKLTHIGDEEILPKEPREELESL